MSCLLQVCIRPLLKPNAGIRAMLQQNLGCMQDPEMQAALGSGDSTREAQLLETWKAYKKGFQQGIALFNVKPKKGIAYLQVSSFLIPLSSERVSNLLAMYSTRVEVPVHCTSNRRKIYRRHQLHPTCCSHAQNVSCSQPRHLTLLALIGYRRSGARGRNR